MAVSSPYLERERSKLDSGASSDRQPAIGVGRCFPFWQEYMACYVINQNDPEARKQGVCAPRLEDYYECLHHKKEVRTQTSLSMGLT